MVAVKEKPKGAKQLEMLQGDGVAGAATRLDRGDLALRCFLGAATRAGEDFSRRFPSYSIGIYFLHISYSHSRRLLASAARSWSGGTGNARGECEMPPTSSWWALETLLTLARCGSGKKPRGARRRWRRDRWRDHAATAVTCVF